MIRVGYIVGKMRQSWPKAGAGDASTREDEEAHVAGTTSPVGPASPEEMEAALAAAEKRYRQSHRRRVCLVSPDGVYHERNLESLRQ